MNTSGVEDNARAIWIAVNAHPNREQVAEHHLRNQGYEPYVPVMRKQIRHARQVRDVLRPLFPGYLFVHLSPAHTVGVVVPISTVKSEVGVNALGFVTVPVQVRLEPVSTQPGGSAKTGPPPTIMLSASAEMKQGGAENADPNELRRKGRRPWRPFPVPLARIILSLGARLRLMRSFPQCSNAAHATPRSEKRSLFR